MPIVFVASLLFFVIFDCVSIDVLFTLVHESLLSTKLKITLLSKPYPFTVYDVICPIAILAMLPAEVPPAVALSFERS